MPCHVTSHLASVLCAMTMFNHRCSMVPQQRVMGQDLSRRSAILGACVAGLRGMACGGHVLVSTFDDILNMDVAIGHPASGTARSRAS
jgi:hypothetical protein